MKSSTWSARALLFGVSSISLAASGALSAVQAQSAIVLDAISVLATKTPERTIDSLAAVSSVRTDQIEQIMPGRVSDVLADVPGVWFQERADDPASSVNIRGLQDFGRVAVVIDGARQNFQRSGHNADGMFYLDPEIIGSADVVRGPVANFYGSGAIGGVVSFTTKNVDDVLKPGEKWGILSRGEIGSNVTQGVGSTFAAFRPSPNFDFILGGVYRSKSNYKDGNGNEIVNSHQDNWTGMAKATFRPADGHQVKLGYIHFNSEYDTGQPGSSIYATKVGNQVANARWTYKPDNRWIDFDGNVYWTNTTTDQTKSGGTGSAISGFIGQSRKFKIDTVGFDAHNTTRFDTGPVQHALTYGGDWFQDEVTTTGFGTVFTPSGNRTVGGAFAQLKSKVSVFELVSAVRYDTYELNGGGTRSDGSRVSPKFTLGITPVTGVTPYITYAEGYRSPSVTETLNSGIHPVAGAAFELLPNPALRPEIGKTQETGLNLSFDNIAKDGDKFRAKFNIYRNDVTDYIEQVGLFTGNVGAGGIVCTNVIFGPPDCLQYQNIAKARLEGAEFEGNYDRGDWFYGLAYSQVHGFNVSTGQRLSRIPPESVTTTVGARFLDRKLTAMVRWKHVAEKPLSEIPTSQGQPAFPPTGSYNLVNFYAGYEPQPDVLASLTVENLLNEQYARYMTYYPNPTNGQPPVAFPQPGITVKGAIKVRFSDKSMTKG